MRIHEGWLLLACFLQIGGCSGAGDHRAFALSEAERKLGQAEPRFSGLVGVAKDGNVIFAASDEVKLESGQGGFAIKKYDPSTQEMATIVGHGARCPVVSPDGLSVAFEQAGRLVVSEIQGRSRVLVANGVLAELSWSPDSRAIAFTKCDPECPERNVFMVEVRSGTSSKVTSDSQSDRPVFLPDSRHIMFVSSRAGLPAIWKIPVSGASAEQLTNKAVGRSVAGKPAGFVPVPARCPYFANSAGIWFDSGDSVWHLSLDGMAARLVIGAERILGIGNELFVREKGLYRPLGF